MIVKDVTDLREDLSTISEDERLPMVRRLEIIRVFVRAHLLDAPLDVFARRMSNIAVYLDAQDIWWIAWEHGQLSYHRGWESRFS